MDTFSFDVDRALPRGGHFLATKALHGLCHSFLARALTCNFFSREGGI
jgi:hypothetical protein